MSNVLTEDMKVPRKLRTFNQRFDNIMVLISKLNIITLNIRGLIDLVGNYRKLINCKPITLNLKGLNLNRIQKALDILLPMSAIL